ncbi:ribonuclease III family protein [Riemerella columbipharyngis]|uniref:Ribonuclease 3 n=1 Tax=Riemerella columbipharyngis TaxID=1071918 RepID=A0A1G6ZRF4_9FLAO|nr:ribonuclease III domain-containing protein [Riemerella columbipharyngis]SDE05364.1 ribonuclease-3 [Riemerella columbipharyngis]
MDIVRKITKLLSKAHKKQYLLEEDRFLFEKIRTIIGFSPKELSWYKEAFSLKTSFGRNNYDRLEFLGDSVLGSIISCYLFEHYPNGNEGFLTQMKSKIVNRKNLNQIGERLELRCLISEEKGFKHSKDLSGNLLESFIGAVYMDFGYEICKGIVLSRIIPEAEMDRLKNKIISYKSLILEWCQKNKWTLNYETKEEILPSKQVVFRSVIFINGNQRAAATETSKKKAEEKVAQRAFYALNKKVKIV